MNYGEPYQAVLLRAGYGTNLATIFTGNVSQAWSVREGVNFITQIECFDGGFAFVNGVPPQTPFPAGVGTRDVARAFISNLPHVEVGAIGNYEGTLSRGNSYSGNAVDILNREILGGGFFIDNGKGNALKTNEYIITPTVPVINAKSGLLGTPVLEQTVVRFDMLFEPSLIVGQKIKLDSITGDGNFNGEYKITAVKHRGTISGAVAGSVITTGEFFGLSNGVGVAP